MSAREQADEHGNEVPALNMARAGVAEALGAFFLVDTGTATASSAALSRETACAPYDSLAVALAFGLVLIALVGALGQVSGAHLNPAVTIGLAAIRKFPWRYVPAYLVSQLIGSILGALATWVTLGSAARDEVVGRHVSRRGCR